MNVCPPNSNVESLSHSVSIFGDEDSKAVIKVKWVHKGGALILYNQCPYKKRYQGILSLSLSLSPLLSLFFLLSLSLSLHVRAHQEVSCLKARKRPPRRNQPCHPFCLQDWQKTNVSCLLKLPSLGLCNGSPRWQRQYVSTSSKQISRQSYGSQEKIQEEIEVCLISCPFKFNHC